jgi:hypothetical protein
MLRASLLTAHFQHRVTFGLLPDQHLAQNLKRLFAQMFADGIVTTEQRASLSQFYLAM